MEGQFNRNDLRWKRRWSMKHLFGHMHVTLGIKHMWLLLLGQNGSWTNQTMYQNYAIENIWPIWALEEVMPKI